MTNKQKVLQLKRRMQQSPTASKYFTKRAALAAENSPESRKAAKSMTTQYHGSHLTNAGLYWQPKSIRSAS